MLIRVLGSAAGGGFPQWNCNGGLSRAAWDGESHVAPRTQSSLAVSADGERWVLLNASPDLRDQILATPALQPRSDGPRRNSPIKAVVLTNADVDAVAGLLTLRERQPFTLYGSDRILDTLAENSIFNVLDPAVVDRKRLPMDQPIPLLDHGDDLGLSVEAIWVPGKVALYLEERDKPVNIGGRSGDTVALRVADKATGAAFFYVPSCARIDWSVETHLRGARLVFFDGTLFDDDELITQGLGEKTGQRMGHMSMNGPDGSLAAFASIPVARKVYIHINNSNPVLSTASAAYRTVQAAGWEVAYDGMEIAL